MSDVDDPSDAQRALNLDVPSLTIESKEKTRRTVGQHGYNVSTGKEVSYRELSSSGLEDEKFDDIDENIRLTDQYRKGKCMCIKVSLMSIVTSLATISGFLFGYDLGLISGALEFIEDDFDLTEIQDELIVMSTKVERHAFSSMNL